MAATAIAPAGSDPVVVELDVESTPVAVELKVYMLRSGADTYDDDKR